MLKKSAKKKKTQVKHKIVIVKANSTPRNRGPRECDIDILFPNYVMQDVTFLIIISIPHAHVSSHQKMDVNV